MKLNNIFPNFDNFNNKVINRLNLLFPNSEWLDEQKALISFNTLYELLNMYYGDYNIRYDAESTFLNKFTFDLADLLPDIYAKQQAFIKNQISEFLSEAKNRAVIVQNDGTQDRDQETNTKGAMSSTPVNKVISSAAELNNVPLTSATLQNLKFVENYNLSNEQTNMNFVKDLTNQLSADYSLRLQEFMNLIKKHFVFIVKSKGKEYLTNSECQFRNGYYVSDVDYLGIENQEQIKLLNVKTEKNKTDIEIIKPKLETNSTNIVDLERKHNQQQTQINQNKTDIQQLVDNDNELWAYLENQYLVDNNLTNMTELKSQVETNKTEINNIKSEQTTQNDDISELKTNVENLNSKVNYNVPITDRNRPYTNGTLLPYTIDNRRVYQCAIKFGSSNGGEANLVNGSFHFFYDVTIINLDTKNLIDPKDWNLRFIPGEAIRGTLPTGGNFAFMCKVVGEKV